jgi:hypothetical protein
MGGQNRPKQKGICKMGWKLGEDKNGTRFTGKTLDEKGKKLLPDLKQNEWVEVRLLMPREINEIVALTEKECYEFQPVTVDATTEMQRVTWSEWAGKDETEKLNSQNLASEMRFCKSLVSFKLFGEDDKEIEVNEDNKKLLMANAKFFKVWFRALETLRRQTEAHTEMLEKN